MDHSQDLSGIYNNLRKFQQKYKDQTVVIKFGGALAEDDSIIRGIGQQASFLSYVIGAKVIVVHGGGRQIDNALKEKAIAVRKDPESGLRITDRPTLEASDAALRVLNGRIVRIFNQASQDMRALGMAGYDGRMVQAEPIHHYTGQATGVDESLLRHLLAKKEEKPIIPVIYPICHHETEEGDETRLNVNADDVASAIATQMGARRLILCSDIPGVLGKDKRLIDHLTTAEIDRLIDDGTVTGGMVAKLRAAGEAAKSMKQGGVVILDGRQDETILTELLYEKGVGTLIEKTKVQTFRPS
jgi:acetylglutamate kinase